MRQKLRQGEWLNLAPVGYVNNPKTRNIEPDPVKAKIIRTIYKEFTTGLFICGECGGAITAQYGKGNGGTYVYYRCSKKFGKCFQPYLRDEQMIKQIRELLQKVSLPDGWAPAAFAKLERWENEERGKFQSFAQNLAADLSVTQSKLDNLVNGLLDGIIDKETYLKKKDELIKQKIELEQRQSHFGQRAKLWIEPMRDWLEMAHKAGKLALSNDYQDKKQMMEKIGTNATCVTSFGFCLQVSGM